MKIAVLETCDACHEVANCKALVGKGGVSVYICDGCDECYWEAWGLSRSHRVLTEEEEQNG